MEILGIGLPEIIFVLLIAVIVMGPAQMQAAGSTVAKWVRSILMSDALMAIRQVSRETRKQWTLFIREANDDFQKIDPTNIGSEAWQGKQKFSHYKAHPKSISVGAKPGDRSKDSEPAQSNLIDSPPSLPPESENKTVPGNESNSNDSMQTD